VIATMLVVIGKAAGASFCRMTDEEISGAVDDLADRRTRPKKPGGGPKKPSGGRGGRTGRRPSPSENRRVKPISGFFAIAVGAAHMHLPAKAPRHA
jgi:hypothetical protein